ncbi:ankyrin repeat domain-containing protein [Candidatus Parcubacteria bacterium]|nr:MAG: ankyrin repeat domain-containing protein [Candidatus Parcubacteria bacterium]
MSKTIFYVILIFLVSLNLILITGCIGCCNKKNSTPPVAVVPITEKAIEELYMAINHEDIEEVKKIINIYPDIVNIEDSWSWTPLYRALSCKSTEIAELLISKGADVNARDEEGGTPLHAAVSLDVSKEFVELLISNGADVNARTNDGLTPLDLAKGGNKEIIELLEKAK